MRRASAVAAVAALAVLGLAACGGGSNNSTTAASAPATTTAPAGGGGGGGASSTVNISTPSGSSLAFNQKSASAKAGSVTIDFNNAQALQHDVAVADSSGKVLGQTNLVSSGTANTTVNLTAGSYTFYCTVPGHREAGMQGTLTVK
jgi:plastocyanin